MITPGRLPTVRDELRQAWQTTLAPTLADTNEHVYTPWVGGQPEPRAAYVRRLLGWLDSATLFFVREDMTAVAVQAGESLPAYELHAHDLPAEIGLLVWQKPTVTVTMARGAQVAVMGMLWGPALVDHEGTPGVHVVTLADAHEFARTLPDGDDATRAMLRAAPLMYHDESPLPFATIPGAVMRNEALRAAMATWLLCGQDLSEQTQAPVDRPVRRTYTRAGRPLPTVRQVALRQPAHGNGSAASEDGPQWQHRWVVRGHWRNHWYPSQQRHRPLWINSHIKGPDGQPLIGGEKVNVLRR